MFSRVKFKAVIIDKKTTLFCTRVMYFGQQQTHKTQKMPKSESNLQQNKYQLTTTLFYIKKMRFSPLLLDPHFHLEKQLSEYTDLSFRVHVLALYSDIIYGVQINLANQAIKNYRQSNLNEGCCGYAQCGNPNMCPRKYTIKVFN